MFNNYNLFAIPNFSHGFLATKLFCGSGVHSLIMDCMRKRCFEFI